MDCNAAKGVLSQKPKMVIKHVFTKLCKKSRFFSFVLIHANIVQGWSQVLLTKYSSTPSTQNIYQVQVLVKYSFFFQKYLSTLSTFISSTSTLIIAMSKAVTKLE